MLILSQSTDTLQVVLAGAVTTNELEITAQWREVTSTTFTPGRTVNTTTGTTPVDIVGNPGTGQIVVDFVSVYNADTVSATVTLRFNDDGSFFRIATVTLGVGERLEYSNDHGVRTYANNGAEKVASVTGTNPAASGINQVVLATDVVNNNATLNTLQDVTGLSFSVLSGGTYWFRFVIDYTAAVNTTGSRWTINGPTTSRLVYRSNYSLSATTETLNILNAYDQPAASNATSIVAGSLAVIEGYATFTNNGTLIARFASEVANSAITAKAGSSVFYVKVV